MERNLRKTRVGVVVSDKMQKTITVSAERKVKHPKVWKIHEEYKEICMLTMKIMIVK
jgi:ribosomal protein S17